MRVLGLEHTLSCELESVGSTLKERHQSLSGSRHRHYDRFSSLDSHGFVFLLSSLVWGATFIHLGRQHSVDYVFDLGRGQSIFKGKNYISCGGSLSDALPLGCEYDILANHCVHKLCLDQDPIREYQQQSETWPGYTDMNWTEVIPTTKAMGESGVYWTNQRDHIVHCALLWKKQRRAFTENRRYRDAIISSEEHVMHCADFLMEMTEGCDGWDWRRKPMTVEVGYAGGVDMGAPST